MRNAMLCVGITLLTVGVYSLGAHRASVVYAQSETYGHAMTHGTVPKSYGRMVTAIVDSIGTGLIFEDEQGVIRFASVTGMKEGELARYDKTATQGGIPKSYGRLVTAVVRNGSTGLIFEDAQGVIRFVTIAGVTEGELTRE